MRAYGFTHVSVHAYHLYESVHFYAELFEMEEVPAPDFPSPVRWRTRAAGAAQASVRARAALLVSEGAQR